MGRIAFWAVVGVCAAILSSNAAPAVPRTVRDEYEDAIINRLEDSFSRSRHREYKWETERHHIVAKTAKAADPAKKMLNSVGLSTESSPNIVYIKTSVHSQG